MAAAMAVEDVAAGAGTGERVRDQAEVRGPAGGEGELDAFAADVDKVADQLGKEARVAKREVGEPGVAVVHAAHRVEEVSDAERR